MTTTKRKEHLTNSQEYDIIDERVREVSHSMPAYSQAVQRQGAQEHYIQRGTHRERKKHTHSYTLQQLVSTNTLTAYITTHKR